MSVAAVGRRIALASVTSSLLCGMTLSAVASGQPSPDSMAEPDVQMEDIDPADFDQQAATLPADLVEAIDRDLDMSAERYLATAAAARVAVDVVDSLGEIVTAAWLDGTKLHIAVRDRADVAAAAATGAEVHVGDGLTDAVAAARGQGQLAYADRREGEVVPVEAELSGGPARDSHQASQVDEPNPGAVPGGYGYWAHDAENIYRCTGGFNGASADGEPRTLTSALCSQGDSGLLDGGVGLLGAVVDDLLDGEIADTGEAAESDTESGADGVAGDGAADEPVQDQQDVSADGYVATFAEDAVASTDGRDFAQLQLTDGEEWTLPPRVAPPGTSEDGGVTIHDVMRPIAGAPVCAAGSVSGWTCGTVVSSAVTDVPVGDSQVSGFLFDACALPGDHGGPIISGHYALGISSASTWTGTDYDTVPDPETPQVALGSALAGGDASAGQAYGDEWNLAVHVGTPDVRAPEDGDVTGPEPTIRGYVEAAAGATVVVDVDDAGRVEAEVDVDGRWRAPVHEPLEPGTHSYTVTVEHAAAGSAVSATSETSGTFEVSDVASLVVQEPAENETVDSNQPVFAGTGDPGARIILEFDGETTTTMVDEDGNWELSPTDTPRAGRFDALVTQEVGDGSTEVEVSGIGVMPSAPLVVGPGGELAPGVPLAGTAVPGSTVAARIVSAAEQPEQAEQAELTERVEDEEPPPGRERLATTDEEGHWEIELDDLPPGTYTATAVQAVDDLTSERSASVRFEVADTSSGERRTIELEEDDLAETGRSPLPAIVAALLLVGLGTAGVVVHRRRAGAQS